MESSPYPLSRRFSGLRRVPLEKDWLSDQYIVQGKSLARIARENRRSPRTIAQELQRHGIAARTPKTLRHDLAGRRFGKLIAREVVGVTASNHAALWHCDCDCGGSKIVARSSLVGDLTHSCGCIKFSKLYQGCGKLSGSYWNRVKRGAESRGLPLQITIADAWQLYLAQNGRCALSGLPIGLTTDYTNKRAAHTASLDRIDNAIGYVPGNVQWVHRDLNMMRRALDINEFINLCTVVADHNRPGETDRRTAGRLPPPVCGGHEQGQAI